MSEYFQFNWRDFVKGLVVSVLSGVLQTIYQVLTAGGQIDFKAVAISAIVALIAYLLKALGTDSSGKLGGKI